LGIASYFETTFSALEEGVRLCIRILLVVLVSGNLLSTFAQDTTTRSGFVVITLVSGNISGLVATESLINTMGENVEQAIISPSPLLTTASMLVPVGATTGNTTAIAFANPSLGSGGVNLVLTDQLGNVVLNTTVQLGPRGQFSRFLNELFGTPL